MRATRCRIVTGEDEGEIVDVATEVRGKRLESEHALRIGQCGGRASTIQCLDQENAIPFALRRRVGAGLRPSRGRPRRAFPEMSRDDARPVEQCRDCIYGAWNRRILVAKHGDSCADAIAS